MSTEVALFQPGDLAPIRLEDAWFTCRIQISRPAAIGTTRNLVQRLPPGNTLLQDGRREKVASLDTLLLQFSKSHWTAIRVQASANYFSSFP